MKRNKQIHKAFMMIFCSDNAKARLEYVQAHWNNNKESETNLTFYIV